LIFSDEPEVSFAKIKKHLQGRKRRSGIHFPSHDIGKDTDAFLGVALLDDIDIEEIGVGAHVKEIAFEPG